MSYNDYMYAVDRSDEYLAHYGIKGMKWGVQKALESGARSSARRDKKIARQYAKASKRLAKLKAKADPIALNKKADAMDKVSKVSGIVGTAGLAAGGGIAGTAKYLVAPRAYNKIFSDYLYKKSHGAPNVEAEAMVKGASSSEARRIGNKFRDDTEKELRERNSRVKKAEKSADLAGKIGAGLGLAGYGVSVGSKIYANNLRKKASDKNYLARKSKEAAQFEREINEAFAGTKYGQKRKRHH